MKKKFNKGFTLIELLVVVAILGLLATIVAVSLTGARARARDGRRASDIRQVELALELFYAAKKQYPAPADVYSGTDGLMAGYLNLAEKPSDPLTGRPYCYAAKQDVGGEWEYYHVGALLENDDSDLLSQDLDGDSTGSDWGSYSQATASSTDCDTSGGNGFPGDEDTAGVGAIYDRGVFPMP